MNRYNSLMYLVADDFRQTTEAIENLQYAVLKAAIVFKGFAEVAHKMRRVEEITLSDLLSKIVAKGE